MNDVLDEVEVAKILDCEPRTVQEKARTGELPAVKFGRSWRFPREALLRKLNELALSNNKNRPPAAQSVGMEKTITKNRRRQLPRLVSLP